MNPSALLRAGADILAPVLAPAGFTFVTVEADVGSGGAYAVGRFVRTADERALELHVRSALGVVVYRSPGVAVEHHALMRAAAEGSATAYPGFSADPLDSFRHLSGDLARYGRAFLTGSDGEFREQAARGLALAEAQRGFRALS